jgi:fructose-1,6-bisphosphatase/inositol monophosphatase family enzyme
MSARTSPRSGIFRRVEEFIKELEATISAAKVAGEVLRRAFGAAQAVRDRGEVDIVTEVDECTEGVIRKSLFGVFPSCWMLAENGELAGEKDTRGSWAP